MTDPQTVHTPVMLDEVIEWLAPEAGGRFADGTLGAGGHARALALRVGSTGLVIATDRDPAAVAAARSRLADLPIRAVVADFADLARVVAEQEVGLLDGVVLDLGLSSDQLADPERGFSFHATGDLDLRFDPTLGEPAWRQVGRMAEQDLANLIYKYGEERHSRRIARRIVAARAEKPIRSAADFAAIVRSAVPRSRDSQRIDPATRTFQALRIAVNDEMASLQQAIETLPDILRPGGRLAIISFHSLEDRLVKWAFRGDGRLEPLTKRPLGATAIEVARNPRARSAKMRVAARVATC